MLLINTSLFSSFPPVEMSRELWELLYCGRKAKKYRKNEFLVLQESPIREMIVVKKGRVKAMFLSAEGREIIFEILIAPAVFGHQALYSDGLLQWYPNLQALSDCEAVFVPIEQVEDLIDRQPQLLKCFYKCLRSNVSTSSSLSLWSQRLNLLQKVAFALTLTGNIPRDEKGYFQLTHENLANFLGVTRENVTVSLNRLSEMGLIEKKPGKIKISDEDAFNSFIGDIYRQL
ncbi:MAG: Crp/Fnr family transcriptional regulator [Clostridiales bacterium]|jgi:CRP-like cAMP-binding protein|nr:Crp/Fnr family transcriptional regulator [Clostridiales bacterium]